MSHNGDQHFKKLQPKQVTEDLDLKERTALICEADEQWSFVQKKGQQHWLWYAVDSVTRKVIAHVFGPRTDATLKRLLGLLKGFDLKFVCTDDWGSYAREIPDAIHLVGKIFTQRIERHNLNLRTPIKRLARRTICFSKSFEFHEKVIGHYLEIHYYNRCVT